MMRHWPDTLPTPIGPGYQLTAADQYLRSDMEVGPARARRMTRARRDRVQAVWVMDPAQFQAFRIWFEDGAWSIAGHSDDLAHWTLLRLTWTAGAVISPSGALCGRLLETAVSGTHHMVLNAPGTGNGNVVTLMATVRAAGRSKVRIGLFGRDSQLRRADFDLTTGAVSNVSAVIAWSVRDRGNGWRRISVTVSVGAGAFDVIPRIGCLDDAGAETYAGDTGKGIDICEINALVGERSLYLPTGASGLARGAAGGPAWSMIPVFTGGPLIPVECRFEQTFSTEVKPGLNTHVTATLEVRHA